MAILNRQETTFTLKANGLVVPSDFPSASYESIHDLVVRTFSKNEFYEHYAGAWNALAYRFVSFVDSGTHFTKLLDSHGASPAPWERYLQERALFELYSTAFSAFECTFYALYTFGAFLAPAMFPLTSAKDQQQVSPYRTRECMQRAFPGDPLLDVIASLFSDPEYQKFREIRNVLTHRTAPGRRMYVSLGEDDVPATEWKLNDAPLDAALATTGRDQFARMLKDLLRGIEVFISARTK